MPCLRQRSAIVRNAGWCRFGWLATASLAATLLAGAAQADTIATLSFSGAAWDDGGSLAGYFTYSYDASNAITAIDLIDFTTGAGNETDLTEVSGPAPGRTYIYDVTGMTTNTTTPQITNATGGAGSGVYEFHVGVLGNEDGVFLDWTGVGTAAAISTGAGGFTSSEEFYSIGDGYREFKVGQGESSGGQSSGSLGGVQVPEPGSLSLVALALGAIGMCRRRTRKA